MAVNPALEKALLAHRGLLIGLCYRMLGNQADAEDLAQDTLERALTRPPADLERDAKPWLVRVAMNACRDRLRARKRQADAQSWLPSPLLTPADDPAFRAGPNPEARYSWLESLSVAFLCTLQGLTPNQRAVLLLRDVFDFSVRETAEILELSEANVKTTLHRARAAMAGYDRLRQSEPLPHQAARVQQALQALFFHVETGNRAALRALLTQDVVLTNDADDKLFAARRPVIGADKVVLFLLKTRRIHRQRAKGIGRARVAMVNGAPAVLGWSASYDRRLPRRFVAWVELAPDGRVARIRAQVYPRKLSADLFADIKAIDVRALAGALRAALAAPPLHRWLPTLLLTAARQTRATALRKRRVPRAWS